MPHSGNGSNVVFVNNPLLKRKADDKIQSTLNIFRERTLTRHVLFSGRRWLDGEQRI